MMSGFDRFSILRDCILYDNRVLIPEIFREEALKMFHEDHGGIVQMKSAIRAVLWYPHTDNDKMPWNEYVEKKTYFRLISDLLTRNDTGIAEE